MPSYAAPVKDMQFVLHDMLNVTETGIPGYDDLDAGFTAAVLEEAGKLARDVLAPLNRVGDVEGCHLENGVVRTPTGFGAAFEALKAGGWPALDCDPAYGGQGLPYLMQTAVGKRCSSARTWRSTCIRALPTGPIPRSMCMARTPKRPPGCQRSSIATGPAP